MSLDQDRAEDREHIAVQQIATYEDVHGNLNGTSKKHRRGLCDKCQSLVPSS